MSQKLQLKSDLTLETAIQIARQSEMVKSQATDQNSRASKDVDEVQSKKTPVSSRWRKKKEEKGFIPKTNSKEVWQMRSPSQKARTEFCER